MSDPLLTFLKYIFLALLYLFFFRVLRAVWVELREPKTVATPSPAAAAAGAPMVAADGAAPPEKLSRRQARRARKELAERPERLVVVDPAERQGQEFALGDELTVGRAAGCGVALPDDTFVSNLHARVFRRDGQLWVEDLGSTNGTFVNGGKLTAPSVVRSGDKLQVGHTTMEVAR